jgi:phosphoenolpyruvate-protein kinase (PTS system EI component)
VGAIESKTLKKRGNPAWVKGGASPNPGGRTSDAAKEQAHLRNALAGEGDEIHAALMALVRAGNSQAIIYAHRQLVGDPKQTAEVDQRTTARIEVTDAAEPEPSRIAGVLEVLDRVGRVPRLEVIGGAAQVDDAETE